MSTLIDNFEEAFRGGSTGSCSGTAVTEPAYKRHWPKFLEAMEARLQTGHREYGDGVFSRDLDTLLDEIEQELLDISGWSHIAWARIQEMRAALRAAIPDKACG